MDQWIVEVAKVPNGSRTRVIRGLQPILAMHAELVDLAARSGQHGAMDYLRYFLTGPYIGSKIPHLILIYAGAGSFAGEDDLVGAVIVQQYRAAGLGLGIFITDDEAGDRTVIAPEAWRPWVAEIAAETLYGLGARLILISAHISLSAMEQLGARSDISGQHWDWHGVVRPMDQYLPILETLEATLATLGKHTRRNLRYYRRRAEEKLSCVFVPCVSMSRTEFLAVNRICAYPVPDKIAGWRYDAATTISGGLFAGVQAGDGTWLSLVGGRHHHDETAIAWQMNRDDMAIYSLSTVMRAYLLQMEVGRGTTKLFFDGGTPHSIHHDFVHADVAYLVATRRSLLGTMLRRGARRFLPRNNFLRRVLLDDGLRLIKR